MDQTTLNNNMIDGQIRPINGISKEVISAYLGSSEDWEWEKLAQEGE